MGPILNAPTRLAEAGAPLASMPTDMLAERGDLAAGSRAPIVPNPLFVGRGHNLLEVAGATFDRLRGAIFDPTPLAGVLDLARFTGRDWLFDRIDRYVATRNKGYIVVQGEAGVGKTAVAAYLAWTRPWVHHF